MSRGDPPFRPTERDRDIVLKAKGFGLRHDQICQLIINPRTGKPIAELTLLKHFKNEIANGVAYITYNVVASLYRQALKGDVGACIFWLKAQARWTERHVLVFDPRDMSEEQLDSAIASVEKLVPPHLKVLPAPDKAA